MDTSVYGVSEVTEKCDYLIHSCIFGVTSSILRHWTWIGPRPE